MARRSRLLDHGGILLGNLVHLVNRRIDISQARGLLARCLGNVIGEQRIEADVFNGTDRRADRPLKPSPPDAGSPTGDF